MTDGTYTETDYQTPGSVETHGSGNILAPTVGVIAAAVSLFANFAFIPAYPIWALIVLTIDVLIIWALTAHGSDMRKA